MNKHEKSFAIEKPRRPWWRRWLKRIGTSLLVIVIILGCRLSWNHYQATKKLDEALAELDRTDPGWRLEEIEAAREQIPEEENSARVVVAVGKLLPKKWPSKEFDDLFTHLSPKEQLAQEDFARLKQELAILQTAVEKARKLAGMPQGRHHIHYARNALSTLLNDQAEGRRVVRLLILDTMRQDQNRDMTSALMSGQAAFNAGRAVGDEPFAMSQLIRTAGVIAACQGVERTLAQGEPPLRELAEFCRLLDSEDLFPDMLISARGERAVNHALFDTFESGDVPISDLSNRRPDWNERLFGFIMRDNIRDEHPGMLALMNQWVAIAHLPLYEQVQADLQFNEATRSLPKNAILTRLFLPALTKLADASRRKHAYLQCLKVACAAEHYRREQKTWPPNVDSLCPGYIDTPLPDPFDGQPLRYRRIDDGIVIYAVGQDGIDNGGNLDREHPNQPGVDIGCRLWDVAKRRQPPRPRPPVDKPAPIPNPE